MDASAILYGDLTKGRADWQKPITESDGSIIYRNRSINAEGNPYEFWTSKPCRTCDIAAEEDAFHRLDGPAYQEWERGILIETTWWRHGQIDREDGPAVECFQLLNDRRRKVAEKWQRRGQLHRQNGPAWTTWWSNGRRRQCYWMENDQLHCADGPAHEIWFESGNLCSETWYWRDQLHRDDGPAEVTMHLEGTVASLGWYQRDQFHRDGGPAWIKFYFDGGVEEEAWYRHGQVHRDDGPATRTWLSNGQLKDQRWLQHDLLHREEGPARMIYLNGACTELLQEWHLDGALHRLGGPASLLKRPNGSAKREWWIRGQRVTRELERELRQQLLALKPEQQLQAVKAE